MNINEDNHSGCNYFSSRGSSSARAGWVCGVLLMLLGAISPAWAQNAKEGEFYSSTPQACPDDTISVSIESEGGRMDTVGIRIYFHQSKVNLLPKYQRNAERLDSFLVELQRIKSDSSLKVRAIRIMGGASPEGTTRFNKWLSEQRAAESPSIWSRIRL